MSRLLPILLLFLSTAMFAQDWKPLTATDPTIAKLRKDLGAMASIKGNIRQEKSFAFLDDKLVSTGYFSYRKENRLRWQFDRPIEYIILIKDNAMRLREAGEEKQYKGVNRILRQVREIILGCIDGSIIDNANYKAAFFGNATSLKLDLQPKDRQLKEFIQRIEVEFAKEGNKLRSVMLTDPSGDITHIHFTDIRTGQTIDEAVFTDF
ncbi:MAG: outer membrane lipoprotein carrier protein LolA [Flavobacteriales bacterium]|nr:outer membrane lipoprotein carrier protein LolA [Flavobacteriales bacterium]